MLEKLIIKNFRCYDEHEVNFKELTVVVGKNNAGKSTLIEALRLVALASNKFKTSVFHSPPPWTELPLISKGIKPSLKHLDINFLNIFHGYGSQPSIIIAKYNDNTTINIYVGNDLEIFCTLTDKNGIHINSKRQANEISILDINILPQISLVEREERILNKDYVKQNISTNLSSRHFRNQISLYYENFPKFKDISEKTWNGIRLLEMEGRNGAPGSEDRLSLIVQDYNFASEIGWLGSGIQMWLQIMWFLSRVDENSIIILDEPDIYMHPDLQRKLIRLLTNNYKQIIIATHSVEIISEVEPNNILIIDKTKSESIYADKIPVVQSILNSIGSIHNLQLTKLWTSKKLLIVEGEDIALLKRLQSTLFPKSSEPFDIIPNFDISGWGGWNYAKGSSLLLKETVDKSVKIYCIFDSDYHTSNQIETRKKEARNFNVNIHIWSKKEIENYLINIDAINRIVLREGNKNMHTYSIEDINKTLQKIVSEMMDDLIDKIAEEIKTEHRDWGISKLRLTAKSYIKSPLDRVGGKDLISKLSKYLQDTYGVSLNPKKIADELKIHEIDSEIRNVITCIETQINFK